MNYVYLQKLFLMKTNIFYLFLISVAFFSCKTQSDIAYFQDLENKYDQGIAIDTLLNYESKIIPDDILSIYVSAEDPNAVAMFNLPAISYLQAGDTEISGTPKLQTYLVDKYGYINYPQLGKIQVAGLTTRQLETTIKKEIEAYVKSPLVTVNTLNSKIVVLGEVNKPGVLKIESERVSILDAIGMAEALTIYGERKNVLLVREKNGKKEFCRFDLTDPAIFSSPYYYLQKNDVIYVEPNKAKKATAKYGSDKQFNITITSTIISAVSTIAALFIAIFK